MALLAFVFAAGIVFLAFALHRVQVVQYSDFSRDQVRQSVRRVQVPGPRGRIFDRNGVVLAENRASYCIAYYVEELRKRGRWQNTIDAVDADIDRLAAVLGIPRVLSKEAVANHVMQSLPMPLLAWRDVDLDGAVWRVAMTKNGTPQNIPLSPEAVMVLQARRQALEAAHKARATDKTLSPYVFPGIGATGHLPSWPPNIPARYYSSLIERMV